MTKFRYDYYKKDIAGIIQLWDDGLIGKDEYNLRMDDDFYRVKDSDELTQKEKDLLLNQFFKDKKDIEQDTKKDFTLFEELGKNLLNILSDYKNKDIKIDEFLKVACSLWDKHDKNESITIFKKVFFELRVYNKLNLKGYFEDNGVCFSYNAKKDRLVVFGDLLQIKQSFLEWKKEQKEQKASLTSEEKISSSFVQLTKKYNKDELLKLIEQLKDYTKKQI